jgi:hypothetical protein
METKSASSKSANPEPAITTSLICILHAIAQDRNNRKGEGTKEETMMIVVKTKRRRFGE